MSAISRIISGSAASWSRLGINLAAQVILVPVFLSHWEPSTYGLWLGIIALATLIQFFDMGHHNYIGYEALRLGAESRSEIARLYRPAVRIALCISAVELLAVTAFIFFGYHIVIVGAVSDGNEHLSQDVGVLLLLYSLSWLLFGNWSSVAGSVLTPFGYYPKIAWWQVVGAMVTALAPAIAVYFGAGLLMAGVAYHVTYAVYATAAVTYVHRMIKKEGLDRSRTDYRYGLNNLLRSLALSFRAVLEMFRQEQFRIVVAPLLGAANLVLFVTTRTVANVIVAGLATVSGPLMPELMRYLNNKDAAKSVAAMSIVWIVLVGILAPTAVAAQLYVAPLFEIWTRGKVGFDPILFALFSMNVLLFALAQPAMAVIQGHNILRFQVAISSCAVMIALIGAYYLAPLIGVKGAAASLLAGELFVATCSLLLSRRILGIINIHWPRKQILVTVSAVAFSVVLIVIASQPESSKVLVLVAALVCAAIASFLLITSLPKDLRELAFSAIKRSSVAP
jgi:O-antigen/teichoic acid export membrane protein